MGWNYLFIPRLQRCNYLFGCWQTNYQPLKPNCLHSVQGRKAYDPTPQLYFAHICLKPQYGIEMHGHTKANSINQVQVKNTSALKFFLTWTTTHVQYFSKPGDTFLSGRRLVLPRLAWPRLALPCLVMPCLVLPGFECDAFLSNIKKWDLYGDVVLMHLLLHLQSD